MGKPTTMRPATALMTFNMKVGRNSEKEFLQVTRGVLGPTRVMSGCLGSHLFRDIEEDDHYVLQSRWMTWEDLMRYVTTREFGAVLLAMDLLEECPEVRFETIEQCDGWELLQRSGAPASWSGRGELLEG